MSFLKNTKIGSRLQFVVVLAAAALVAVQAIGLTELRSTLLQDRKQKTEEHVQTAHSLIAHYHSLSENGGLSVSDAQKSALAAVEKLRYAGKEYFWVNDMQPKMLMHPYAKKLNGKDLSELEDPTGKKLFVEFVSTVRASKGGFVDYLWPKPGADEPVAKISYVLGFAPWNWVVGSGIYIDDVNTIFLTEIKKTLAITLGLLFLLIATTFIITLSITRRLARTTNDMETLAQGQFDFDVSYGEDKDEIGALARALAVFRDNAIKMDHLSAEKKETDRRATEEESRRSREVRETEERAEQEKRATEQKATEEGKRARIELADAFEKSVMGVVETLSSATAELQSSAQTMSTTADQTSQQATAVAAASEEATVNVQTVASSAEELSASIEEISRQVTQSNQIAQNAVTEARLTNEKVEGLAEAAQKIGDVVSLINDIASQTNLLALNATIEAARAGDAGKGFAVVASEVKSLATQTGKATEEIAAQITAIQTATGEAVGAIQGIGSTIGELGEIASSVAAAVDEQGSATREIASSVQQAAAGTQEVSGNITQVTQAASESQVSSGQMLGAAKELAEQGDILRREVDKFLQEIRAA